MRNARRLQMTHGMLWEAGQLKPFHGRIAFRTEAEAANYRITYQTIYQAACGNYNHHTSTWTFPTGNTIQLFITEGKPPEGQQISIIEFDSYEKDMQA